MFWSSVKHTVKLSATPAHTHFKTTHHTHTHTHTRTKCPAPVSLCKRRLPYVSQTAGDIFFCSLLFPLISFVGYCGRSVWVSLMCVCVCVCVCVYVGEGGGRPNRRRDVILTVTPFWDQDRKWAQQRKCDLLPLSSLPLWPYVFFSSLCLPLSPPPLPPSPRPCLTHSQGHFSDPGCHMGVRPCVFRP